MSVKKEMSTKPKAKSQTATGSSSAVQKKTATASTSAAPTTKQGLVGKTINIEINKKQSNSAEFLDFTFVDGSSKFTGNIHVTEAEEIDNPLTAVLKQLEEREINTITATITAIDNDKQSISVNPFNRSNLNQSFQLPAKQPQKIPVWVLGRPSPQSNDIAVIVNRSTIGLLDIMSTFQSADDYYTAIKTPFKQLYCYPVSTIDATTLRLKIASNDTPFKAEVNKSTIAMVKQIGTLSMKLVLPGNLPAEIKAIDVSRYLHTHPFSIYTEGDLLDVKILAKSASGILVGTYDIVAKLNPIHPKKPAIRRKRIDFNEAGNNFNGYAYVTAIYTDMVRVMLSTGIDAVMMMDTIPELYRSYLAVGRHVAITGARDDKTATELSVMLTVSSHKVDVDDVAVLTVVGFSKNAMTVSIYGSKNRGLIYPSALTTEKDPTIEMIQQQYKVGDILIGKCTRLSTPTNPFLRFTARESDLEGVDIESITRPPWAIEDEPFQPITPNKYKTIDLESIKTALKSGASAEESQKQQWTTTDFDSLSANKKRKQPEDTKNKQVEAEEDIIDEDDILDEKKHKQEKKKSKHLVEQEIKEKEDLLSENNIQPESSQDFERVLLGSPNSSFIWVKYMSFYLGLNEINKAREIGERALKKIVPTEVLELRNVWIALFNLENMFGTKDSLLKLFQKAIQYQDPKTMYFSIVNILEATSKFDAEEEYFKMFFKKFRHSAKVWCRYGEFLIRANKIELFHQILKRSTDSLPKRKQVEVISKFAQLEFKLGEAERGRTIFEGLVSSYPTRTDLWNIFVDMEIKLYNTSKEENSTNTNNEYIKRIRQLFERTITLKTSDRNIKQFFKRYLQFEKENGDQQSIEHVKQSALAYVEGNNNNNDN